MNKNVLTEEELQAIYCETWAFDFQRGAGGAFTAYSFRHNQDPPFDFIRHATFQYFRWVVASRNARLMFRPVVGSWDEIEVPVERRESAFEDWWQKFPQKLEDCLIGSPEPSPLYDLEYWLLYPEYSRYTIEWDLESPPEKFGDKPFNYPN